MAAKKRQRDNKWYYRPRVTTLKSEIPEWNYLISLVKQQGGINRFLSAIGKEPGEAASKEERHYHKTETVYEAGGAQTLRVESTRIRTVEELIAYHEIDTDAYDVTPSESTYWESGAKLPDGTIITIPLHRLKVRIAPKKTEAANVYQLLCD